MAEVVALEEASVRGGGLSCWRKGRRGGCLPGDGAGKVLPRKGAAAARVFFAAVFIGARASFIVRSPIALEGRRVGGSVGAWRCGGFSLNVSAEVIVAT